MFLHEFTVAPEGHSDAERKTKKSIKKIQVAESEANPCWKGYKKTKNSKQVPNCVPKQVKETKGLGKHAKIVKEVNEDSWHGEGELWHGTGDAWHGSDGGGAIGAMPMGDLSDMELAEDDEIDTITVDVPLLIRLLEYAKEDAETDMDLHHVAERLIAMCQDCDTLTMKDYNNIVGSN